jgi:hypothetical protein
MGESPAVRQRPRRLLGGGQAWTAEGSTDASGADRVQRAVEPGQSATAPAQGTQQPEESHPTAEQVADRVYELLVRDLRLENERLGR